MLCLFLCVCLITGCSKKVSEKKLSEIKPGFSKEMVVNILGKPIKVGKYEFRGKMEEVWYYSDDPAASTNQQIIFDAEKGVVLKVIHLE